MSCTEFCGIAAYTGFPHCSADAAVHWGKWVFGKYPAILGD